MKHPYFRMKSEFGILESESGNRNQNVGIKLSIGISKSESRNQNLEIRISKSEYWNQNLGTRISASELESRKFFSRPTHILPNYLAAVHGGQCEQGCGIFRGRLEQAENYQF